MSITQWIGVLMVAIPIAAFFIWLIYDSIKTRDYGYIAFFALLFYCILAMWLITTK